jgi:predicted methyltransferase MtxX (methanogen marker protein 4)
LEEGGFPEAKKRTQSFQSVKSLQIVTAKIGTRSFPAMLESIENLVRQKAGVKKTCLEPVSFGEDQTDPAGGKRLASRRRQSPIASRCASETPQDVNVTMLRGIELSLIDKLIDHAVVLQKSKTPARDPEPVMSRLVHFLTHATRQTAPSKPKLARMMLAGSGIDEEKTLKDKFESAWN